MALKLLVLDRTKEQFYRLSEAEYLKRLTKYCKLSYIEVPASKKSEKREECLTMEESSLLKHIAERDYIILLDEDGKEFTSRQFASELNNKLVNEPNIVFIIGGAFGFSEAMRIRANDSWSLSKLTFPHHLVRTVFLEQLYRAFTILNGESYHND
jgi:23S rRNA (pseudouridine1915-N3)-methyltransferase